MLKTLRWRLVLYNMALMLGLFGVMFGLIFHITRVNLERESLRAMQRAAEELFRPGPPEAEAGRSPCFVIRIGPDGQLLAAGHRYFDLSDPQWLQAVLDSALSGGEQQGVLSEYGLRFCRLPSPGGEQVVFADISGEQAALTQLIRTGALLGGAGFAGLFGVSLLLSRRAVRPVEQAWNRQRQFVADASHELKTPLSVILTNVQLLQSGDTEQLEVCLDRISRMSRRMSALTVQLLELARLDNSENRAAFAPVALSRLAEDGLLPMEPVFFERGLTLRGEIQPEITVWGDEDRLRQVVEILLDNAQKYSEPGETCLSLTRQGRQAVLSVSNPGPAIPPEELPLLFDRFYRSDKARSAGGSGLGLSIARSIAEAHRGRLWAESRDGINRFSLALPLWSGKPV